MSLDITTIEAAIAAREQEAPFSGVVQVREAGQVVFAQGYGYANRADKLPNQVTTRFGTASGCKIFTAVAVLHLIEQGKLAFDTPLSACAGVPLPQWDAENVTVRHLLTHSSGIPDYFDEEELDAQGDFADLFIKYPVYTLRQPADFLPMFATLPQKFAPGARFHYNNGGFIMLAQIVQHVSGEPFADYVQKHVFTPAGMTDSGYFAMNQLPERTASGYVEHEDGTWHTNIFDIPVIGGGDGGAFVTAPDMAAFWDALYSNRLLSAETTAAMLSPQIEAPWQWNERHYGYGLWMTKRNGEMFRQYVVGGDPGVAFISGVFPAGHNGATVDITIIGNTEGPAWGLSNALTAALFPENS